nr:hypothetical protein [uncultured Acetatifactor sp.]
MSNDLISRKAVIELIENCHVLEDAYCLVDYINELPITYDVDKVVERLEENAKYFQSESDGLAHAGNWGAATDLQGRATAYKDSADIVKFGGIE